MSMVTDGESERTPVLVTLPSGVVVNLTRAQAGQLREDIGQWQTENRKKRRREGLRVQAARAQPSVPAEERKWPPDPYWGTDEHGRFRYVDYDGESLHVWRDKDGELWIDKKGEGPVYVRGTDVPMIVRAIEVQP